MTRGKAVALALALVAISLAGLMYVRFNQRYVPTHGKGGVGVLRPNVYVLTKGPTNQVLWGASRWVGQPRAQVETVVFNGSAVESASCAHLFERPLVIRFTPDRIHAYDLRTVSGGYYLRASD